MNGNTILRLANGLLAIALAIGSVLCAVGDLSGKETVTVGKSPIFVACSPRQHSMYVSIYGDDQLLVFMHNSLVSTINDNDNGALLKEPGGIALSPDGKHVYVASWSDDAVNVFDRDLEPPYDLSNPRTYTHNDGSTKLRQAVYVAVSHDGANVYATAVGSDSLVTFTRASDGSLSNPSSKSDINGMSNPYDLAISYDNENVYVAAVGSDAIVTWDRDLSTGSLSNKRVRSNNDGSRKLKGAISCAVSHDDLNVYVVSIDSDAIVTFTRSSDGSLTDPSSLTDNSGTRLLNYARYVVVSLDDRNVYVVARNDDSIVKFDRSLSTGALSNPSSISDGTNMASPYSLCVNAFGVFVPGFDSDKLVSFRRELF